MNRFIICPHFFDIPTPSESIHESVLVVHPQFSPVKLGVQ